MDNPRRFQVRSGRRWPAVGADGGLSGGLTVGPGVGLSFGLSFGLVVGLVFGLGGDATLTANQGFDIRAFNPSVGLSFGLFAGLAFGPGVGLSFGLVVGLVFGLASGLVDCFVPVPAEEAVAGPYDALKTDLRFMLISPLFFMPVFTLVIILVFRLVG